MNYIKTYQLDYLLMLSGTSLIIFLFTLILKFDNRRTKFALLQMEVCSFILTTADRLAYIYRGNETTLGWWMVRITNFLVFFSLIAEMMSFNVYVNSVLNEKKLRKRFLVIFLILSAGIVSLVISQWTGWYYAFDSTNHYHRNSGFVFCYIFPIASLPFQLSLILGNYSKLSKRIRFSILLFPIFILCASIVQLFVYGISVNTMCYASIVILLFICAIYEVNGNLEIARQKEINALKEQAKNIQELFSQTTQALSGAIDAKDKYTHGHSVRVAQYSQKMAELAGLSKEECNEIYFAGLLHDVGKIGISDTIINKGTALTEEEFAEIKKHPVVGKEILETISRMPYLSIGANYHHERFDGTGYPEGLKGESIPEFARIIAVADAYDAMTSKRSYRDPLPQYKVREELIKGMGSQFDPFYAKEMIHLIDLDKDFKMKENPDDSSYGKKNSN